MNLFVCYPKCSTCNKAKSWLEENNVSFLERDIKLNKPNFDELKEWYLKSGKEIDSFFNKSGLVYKSLNLKDKLKNMSLEEKLNLLSTDGMLVKRPILITDNKVLIGFKEEDYKSIL